MWSYPLLSSCVYAYPDIFRVLTIFYTILWSLFSPSVQKIGQQWYIEGVKVIEHRVGFCVPDETLSPATI